MAPRTYQSPVRARAAQATRAAIVEAARVLFVERGYAQTSVAAIAERAGVALNTVYTSIGGKPALISAISEDAVADTAIDSAVTAIEHSADGAEILRITAHHTGDVTRRRADTLQILLQNQTSEPAVATAAEAAIGRYRERLARIARRLHAIGALQPGLDEDRAAQILWFFFGASAWSTARDLGWDWDEAAGWLAEQAAAALLTEPGD